MHKIIKPINNSEFLLCNENTCNFYTKGKKNKYLLFSSVGDNTTFFKYWLSDNKNYDVAIVYYGDNNENYNKYCEIVDYIECHKGSKFQNFYYYYNKHKDYLLNTYDYFFIVDDDIIIDTENINKLFDLSNKYQFWISQPSFREESKISHTITIQQKSNLFRYTNFVEVNTPIISNIVLNKLMNAYDPKLIGWGIDYLFIQILGLNNKDKYAVIDNISCINPLDHKKPLFNKRQNNYKRELNLLSEAGNRALIWDKIAEKMKLKKYYKKLTHKIIKLDQ